jgi:hypothetical protein
MAKRVRYFAPPPRSEWELRSHVPIRGGSGDPSSEKKSAEYEITWKKRALDPQGRVIIEWITESFGMSRTHLADTVGVKPETLQRSTRASAPKTQVRLKEMLEIVCRVADWAGGSHQAMAWYRAEPIPEFGGRTAESLVKEGKAAAVRDYLDHVALGGFA